MGGGHECGSLGGTPLLLALSSLGTVPRFQDGWSGWREELITPDMLHSAQGSWAESLLQGSARAHTAGEGSSESLCPLAKKEDLRHSNDFCYLPWHPPGPPHGLLQGVIAHARDEEEMGVDFALMKEQSMGTEKGDGGREVRGGG